MHCCWQKLHIPRLKPSRLRARRTPCSLCYSRFKFILEEEISMAHAPQFLKFVHEAKKKVKETNVADVKRRIDAGEKFLLVDVREDNEWSKGHLPGAVHLGKGI